MSLEKGSLLEYEPTVRQKRPVNRYKLALAAGTVIACAGFTFCDLRKTDDNSDFTCAQVPVLAPQQNVALWEDLGDLIESEKFINRSIEWLSGAVQIQCVGPLKLTSRKAWNLRASV